MESREIPKITKGDLESHFGENVRSIRFRKDKLGEKAKKRRKELREKELPPPIDLDKVIFTNHALERFAQRFKETHPGHDDLSDPREVALKILTKAKEEGAINPAERVKRLINSGLEEARYFLNSGWRFVVIEEEGKFIVKTIERASR